MDPTTKRDPFATQLIIHNKKSIQMEVLKLKDNPPQNAAYEFGFIQGIKLQLQKMIDLVNTEPDPATGGHYVVVSSILINHANAMPTVIECGKYRLDITTNERSTIVFDWIPEKKSEMLDLLNH